MKKDLKIALFEACRLAELRFNDALMSGEDFTCFSASIKAFLSLIQDCGLYEEFMEYAYPCSSLTK